MRKAQMELLGLAMVVVIVSIGLMYLLVFSVAKPPKLIHAKYLEKEIGQNFIGAMLKTQSRACKGLSIGELLQDCANFDSTGGSIQCNTDQYSCAYAQQELEEMLGNTVYRWNFVYRFRVYKEDQMRDPIIPKNCDTGTPCPSGQHCVTQTGTNQNSVGNCVSDQITDVVANPFNPDWQCSDRSNKETPGVQPMPLDVGTLTVMLEICRG